MRGKTVVRSNQDLIGCVIVGVYIYGFLGPSWVLITVAPRKIDGLWHTSVIPGTRSVGSTGILYTLCWYVTPGYTINITGCHTIP